MIKAVPKPLEEVLDLVKDFNKVLIVGCDGCVTVCEAGGAKEAKVLASASGSTSPRQASRPRLTKPA